MSISSRRKPESFLRGDSGFRRNDERFKITDAYQTMHLKSANHNYANNLTKSQKIIKHNKTTIREKTMSLDLNTHFAASLDDEPMSLESHRANWAGHDLAQISRALNCNTPDASAVAEAMYEFAKKSAESAEYIYEFTDYLKRTLKLFGEQTTLEITHNLIGGTQEGTPLYHAIQKWCQHPTGKTASPKPTPL